MRRGLWHTLLLGGVVGHSGAWGQNLQSLGPELDLAENPSDDQTDPSVAIDDEGRWWALWDDVRPGYRLSIRGFDDQGRAEPQERFDDDALRAFGEFHSTASGRRGQAIGRWTTIPGGGSFYAEAARLRTTEASAWSAPYLLAPPSDSFIFSGFGDASFSADGSFTVVWGGRSTMTSRKRTSSLGGSTAGASP